MEIFWTISKMESKNCSGEFFCHNRVFRSLKWKNDEFDYFPYVSSSVSCDLTSKIAKLAGIYMIITATVGLAGVIRSNRCLLIAYLVLAIIASIAAFVVFSMAVVSSTNLGFLQGEGGACIMTVMSVIPRQE